MKKLQQSLALAAVLLSVPATFAQKGVKKEEAPTASITAEPAAAQPRGRTPQMDATAFGFGAGQYGSLGFLGGHLQIGVADWLRLHGGITGSLPGDQPSGNFATSNYAFHWLFTGGLMFTGNYYKNIARPYTMLDLTYYLDARSKAGGLNGGIRFGVDLYMTEDWAVYVEAGVNLAFMRETQAPANVGGVVGVGVRTFF
ncbi:MAG TPA: hypothetical protein PLF85_17310 [Turneriella sp.]|nr:hypothetical protein [Turneriella sp.]